MNTNTRTFPAGTAVADGYDVIGDIHGHADKLVRLLIRLGYRQVHGVWEHPSRQVVFVGDLIDRGPAQQETVRIARAMVESGTALMVLGNHEYNAVAFATPVPGSRSGRFCRVHGSKNIEQHRAFLDAYTDPVEYREVIDWFMTIPMWLDLGGLRVVHAAWNDEVIEAAVPFLGDGHVLTVDAVVASTVKGSVPHAAVEYLLKGPEVPVPAGSEYADKDGHVRSNARVAWWRQDEPRYDTHLVMPSGMLTASGEPHAGLPSDPIPGWVPPTPVDVPVVFGHYWFSGELRTVPASTHVCVDFSAGKGGPLVAYRWSGERVLTADNLVAVP